MENTAHVIGTLVLLVSGIAALALPNVLADLLSLRAESRGKAELRVNFGAFWIGLGAAALYLNQAAIYQTLGIGWAVIVVVRLIAYFVDRPQPMRLYWLLLLGEVITAALLLV